MSTTSMQQSIDKVTSLYQRHMQIEQEAEQRECERKECILSIGSQLLEDKENVPRGEWGWFCEQLPFTKQYATRYMSCARNPDGYEPFISVDNWARKVCAVDCTKNSTGVTEPEDVEEDEDEQEEVITRPATYTGSWKHRLPKPGTQSWFQKKLQILRSRGRCKKGEFWHRILSKDRDRFLETLHELEEFQYVEHSDGTCEIRVLLDVDQDLIDEMADWIEAFYEDLSTSNDATYHFVKMRKLAEQLYKVLEKLRTCGKR